MYTLFATKDPSLRAKGISCFLVPRDTPGISIGKHEDKLGYRTSCTNDVIFEDVRIPLKNMIGGEGQGMEVVKKSLGYTRPTSGAGAVGNAQYAYECAVEYSKTRETFGKPICKNQAIAFMLADMATKLTAAKELVYMAAQMKDRNDPNASMYCSMAKYFASETCNEIAAKAVQIHGGYGYIKEYPVERKYRDCRVFTIYEGTSQVQQMVISGNLLK